MSWSNTVLKIKLRGAELNLEEELKKPASRQNKTLINSLKKQIADLKNQIKNL